MSINSRITTIEEHIENAYNILEIAGTDTTNLNKNITNINTALKSNLKNYLANGTNELWNNWNKIIANDVISANLNNTIEAKMNIDLKGNSSQFTTTGKNLYDIQDLVKGRLDNGVIGYESGTESLTKNSDSYTMTTNANYRGASTEHYISVDSSTDYVLSFTTSSTTNAQISMYDNDKNFISNATYVYLQDGSIKITTTAETKYVRIAILLSATGTGTINKPLFMKRKHSNRLRTLYRRQSFTKPRLSTKC